MFTPNKLVFTFGFFLHLCQFSWISIKNCESAHRRTHGQRQPGFMICPVLCAIATGQITSFCVMWLQTWHKTSVAKSRPSVPYRANLLFYSCFTVNKTSMILKPNIDVTSSTCYRCGKFSVVWRLAPCVYLSTTSRFFLHKKLLWIALCTLEFAYTELAYRNWSTNYRE